MIRESLISWRKATEKLILILDVQDDEKRDEVIEQVESLLVERENLQASIQAPFTDEEFTFGQELLPLEKILQAKLKVYLKDIRVDIADQQKRKCLSTPTWTLTTKSSEMALFTIRKNKQTGISSCLCRFYI